MIKHYFRFLVVITIFISSCESTDENREIIKFYGDVRDDTGYSIARASDGYYICGQMTEVWRKDGYITGSEPKPGILKTDFEGNMIWKKYLGNEFAGSGSKVIVVKDNLLICAGHVIDSVFSETDIYLAMLNASGVVVKEVVIELDDNQTCTDLVPSAGGFLLLGTTDAATLPDPGNPADSVFNYAGYLDILLVRLNSNLETIEAKQWGYPWNDRGVALRKDRSGGYVLAGTTDRHANKGRKNDAFLMRVNDVANITRPVILNSAADEYVSDLEVLDDGYLIAGTTGSESEFQRPYFARVPFDIYDTVYYPVPYSGISSWSVNALARYGNNYFVAAGKQVVASSADKLFFVIDEWGNLSPGKEVIFGSSGSQVAFDAVCTGDLYVVGTGMNTNETNSMISFFKFRF
ncbi:MAG TPA: hypothetical protein PLV06_11925 [Bacteroidales bacterium]|nr:hypothetical protein [Bacteroidales bacterium]HPF03429.1 hypothetical protein [Bacteroidales bacterium]HPJ59949.1 hypothetical protein [Bacteroidales bacterium]HPR13086.1 hypothetical protein [Bacteroidales bacterium]HRW85706.1 hypothetical protein [Bacteroidales bacterium]